MNSIEEILWRYIDGLCTPEEQQVVQALIAEDESYRLKYQELMALNAGLEGMELDEPPMAFTYNVMEHIRTEHALVPLKAAINKKIIWGIAAFFTVMLVGMLILMAISVKWTGSAHPLDLSAVNKLTSDVTVSQTKTTVQVFMFLDVVLGLYLFDAFLRKRSTVREA